MRDFYCHPRFVTSASDGRSASMDTHVKQELALSRMTNVNPVAMGIATAVTLGVHAGEYIIVTCALLPLFLYLIWSVIRLETVAWSLWPMA
jgi:hypothetical protein